MLLPRMFCANTHHTTNKGDIILIMYYRIGLCPPSCLLFSFKYSCCLFIYLSLGPVIFVTIPMSSQSWRGVYTLCVVKQNPKTQQQINILQIKNSNNGHRSQIRSRIKDRSEWQRRQRNLESWILNIGWTKPPSPWVWLCEATPLRWERSLSLSGVCAPSHRTIHTDWGLGFYSSSSFILWFPKKHTVCGKLFALMRKLFIIFLFFFLTLLSLSLCKDKSPIKMCNETA